MVKNFDIGCPYFDAMIPLVGRNRVPVCKRYLNDIRLVVRMVQNRTNMGDI